MELAALARQAYGGTEPKRQRAEVTLRAGIKRCSRCKEWKRVDGFGTSRGRGDGLNNKCRDCAASYLTQWHQTHEGKHAEYTNRSRYGTDAARARNAENRLRHRCTAYGITADVYRALLADQHGACAICGRTPEQNGKALAIDHDHRCCPEQMRSCGSCVRGLLCSPCNVAVGYFESEQLMTRCTQYIERKGDNPVGPG